MPSVITVFISHSAVACHPLFRHIGTDIVSWCSVCCCCSVSNNIAVASSHLLQLLPPPTPSPSSLQLFNSSTLQLLSCILYNLLPSSSCLRYGYFDLLYSIRSLFCSIISPKPNRLPLTRPQASGQRTPCNASKM